MRAYGRAAGVAMSGYHPGKVGGGGSKQAGSSLARRPLMTSIFTPHASQSRSDAHSFAPVPPRGPRLVSAAKGRAAGQPIRARTLAAQRWPSEHCEGWAEATAKGRAWRASRCLGREQATTASAKSRALLAHRATHGHADHFVDQALAIRQSHELRETKYMIDVVDAADPSA